MMRSSDERTKWTAGDSFICKYHAILKKYYEDAYAEPMYRQLTRKISALNMGRRTPLMNRGYYIRVLGFRMALEKFLLSTAGQPCQLVYMGAGFDSSPMSSFEVAGPETTVFEIDFPDIMNAKLEMYQGDRKLSHFFEQQSPLPSAELPVEVRRIGRFSLIGADLRDSTKLVSILRIAGFNPELPTLFFSECVLVYIEKQFVDELSSSMATLVNNEAMWVTYDMINPHDRYGQVMVHNLAAAGFHIPGIKDFPTLEAERNKFLNNGWCFAQSCTMRHFYDTVVTEEEKKRMKDLEIVDEVEEWNLIMEHYSLTIASKVNSELTMIANPSNK